MWALQRYQYPFSFPGGKSERSGVCLVSNRAKQTSTPSSFVQAKAPWLHHGPSGTCKPELGVPVATVSPERSPLSCVSTVLWKGCNRSGAPQVCDPGQTRRLPGSPFQCSLGQLALHIFAAGWTGTCSLLCTIPCLPHCLACWGPQGWHCWGVTEPQLPRWARGQVPLPPT